MYVRLSVCVFSLSASIRLSPFLGLDLYVSFSLPVLSEVCLSRLLPVYILLHMLICPSLCVSTESDRLYSLTCIAVLLTALAVALVTMLLLLLSP